jgi:ferredoxin, 2Fe-2S
LGAEPCKLKTERPVIIRDNDIVFTVLFGNKKYKIQTYQGAYRNLMQLITDKIFIEDFGDCKGMGRCGTCMVTITNWKTKEPLKERNEAATLNKAGNDNKNIRLSCQILITEDLSNAIVSIEDTEV